MNIPVIPTFSYSCQVAYLESPPIYLGMSLELLWTVWSHFKVRYSLVLACNYPQKPIVAPQMQSQLNCRSLISCTCCFLGTCPFFSPLRLASSASRSPFSVCSLPWYEMVRVASHLGSLAQLCCGERGTLQVPPACVGCPQWLDHTWLPQPSAGMHPPGPSCVPQGQAARAPAELWRQGPRWACISPG